MIIVLQTDNDITSELLILHKFVVYVMFSLTTAIDVHDGQDRQLYLISYACKKTILDILDA